MAQGGAMDPAAPSTAGRHWPLLLAGALLAGALMGGVGAASLPPYQAGQCGAESRLAGVTLADGKFAGPTPAGGKAAHAVIVTSVRSGADAAPAGIAVGDRIETVDGQQVHTLRQLGPALAHGDGKLARVQLHHAMGSYTVALAEDCHDPSHPRGRR